MSFSWREIFGRRGDRPPVGFVFLQREWQPLSDDSLLQKANAAYGKALPANGVQLLAGRTTSSRILRVENLFIAFHQVNQRYRVSAPDGSAAERMAWDDHTCWSALDLSAPKPKEEDKPQARLTLLYLTNFVWNENITGLYIPERAVTVPNLGSVVESFRWASRNGTDLKGLFPTKSG